VTRASSAAAPAPDVALDSHVIGFDDGIPGFEACRRFVVASSPELAPLQQLQCVDGPAATFIGIDPRRVLPSYSCELSPVDRTRLGVTDDSVLLWLALIAIDDDGTVTANLRAPIVINPLTMTGRQILPRRALYALAHVVTTLE
jgi:flagellar assembly factor FliW